MNKQEINIYREIQRNTEMAMKALDAVTDKSTMTVWLRQWQTRSCNIPDCMTEQCRNW